MGVLLSLVKGLSRVGFGGYFPLGEKGRPKGRKRGGKSSCWGKERSGRGRKAKGRSSRAELPQLFHMVALFLERHPRGDEIPVGSILGVPALYII